ncbi:MAG: hypothetical protein J3Q66DRAFT_366818 [Benniella sp.]|nr:MAG: hypothetical protein J3Q66DRAFT_366818 [Benniella sp.]
MPDNDHEASISERWCGNKVRGTGIVTAVCDLRSCDSSSKLFDAAQQEQVKVGVQKGPTPGEAFVFWSDVQSVFPDMRSIRNGEFGVPFMKDRDYNLITPWRIVHSPGIILEAVTGSDTQSRSTSEVVDVVNIKTEDAELIGQDNHLNNQLCTEISVDTSLMTCNTVTPTIDRMDANGQALVGSLSTLSF